MDQSAPSHIVREYWGAHDIADRPVVALDESPSRCWIDRLLVMVPMVLSMMMAMVMRCTFRVDVFLRVIGECLPAAFTAKVVSCSLILSFRRCFFGYVHATHWIYRHFRFPLPFHV
jgi:hypothetical protein